MASSVEGRAEQKISIREQIRARHAQAVHETDSRRIAEIELKISALLATEAELCEQA